MRNKDLLKYAGLATQLFATLGVAFFIGYWADHKIGWKFPVIMILLPIIALISIFWKIYLDATKRDEK
ncbi:MAG TPA: AtpZ/AtpI family protein [Chitinophagaceae bacterium]|mgnify:FL=1|nr:AtpZ/AtpI family protein [Chitinophagaceae bacterium]